MQTAANIRLFLTSISSFKDSAGSQNATGNGRFYQQIVSKLTKSAFTNQSIKNLADSLVTLADHAYAFREMDDVEKAGQILLNLPLPRQYEIVGQYYQTLYKGRHGKLDEARASYGRIADQAPPRFRARAINSMGGLAIDSGDFQSAFSYYVEALRFAGCNSLYDPMTTAQAQRGIAVLKSIDGDHRGALDDLEKLFPIVRAAISEHPHLYYDYMNSLAVELGETGRLEEAQNASRIALASRFASAYPEWRETAEELELKRLRPSRSVVAFSANANKKIPDTVTVLPLRAPQSAESADSTRTRANRLQRPAPVLDFQLWKKRREKEPADKPAKEMSTREMLLRILELISEKSITDDQLAKMLEAVENIALESKG